MASSFELENRILVLAPLGKDAQLIALALQQARFNVVVCSRLSELCAKISEGCGLVIVASEALSPYKELADSIQHQPPWSDLPILILTGSGEVDSTVAQMLSGLLQIGNVSLIERPLRTITLISAVKQSLRSRARQYEIRGLIDSLKSSREAAEHASRMKDEFLAVVSHELRTPLTPILGWAKMLQSEVPELDRHKAGMVIERNIQLQTKVIDDLLDVSRIISGKLQFKMKPFKLAQAVNAAVETIRPAANAKQIEVQVQLHSDPEIFGDAGRIQQSIWNVLGNAIKFTPHNGRIRISMDSGATCAEVTIQDNGEGIEPQFLKTIFKRFAQADSSSTRLHGGLGLGLSIVRHIVEAHAGTISASSPGKGKGATFTILIPIEAAAATVSLDKAGLARTRNQMASIQGTSILLVEDDKDSLDVISSALQCAGAKVSCATSAQDARGFLERHRPDVIVSDIGMPEEDGYSFIRKLRRLPLERGGQIPAVALTAFAKEEDRMAAFSAGFQRHMSKPVDLSELVEVVATVVKGAAEQRGAQATE